MDNTAAVVDALRRAPQIVVPLVREVPPAILKRRPAPARWSAHEHACHLAHVHGLFFDRLAFMLDNPAPVIRPYLPGEQDPDDLLLAMDLDASLERYVADRARLVERIANLTPAEWARTATHAEYRTYSVFIMFRHLARCTISSTHIASRNCCCVPTGPILSAPPDPRAQPRRPRTLSSYPHGPHTIIGQSARVKVWSSRV
jgi:hypothetical protein